MASVDLEELIPDILVELNVPGGEVYAAVSGDEWVARLRNGFWNAHLDGLMNGWTELEGFVSRLNDPSADAMTRDQQQIIIIYTAMNAIKNNILSLNTAERYKAGSVSFEVERSYQIYKSVLEDMSKRLERILERLSDANIIPPTYYIDTYAARQEAIFYDLAKWIN
jgi:hypothetical protein